MKRKLDGLEESIEVAGKLLRKVMDGVIDAKTEVRTLKSTRVNIQCQLEEAEERKMFERSPIDELDVSELEIVLDGGKYEIS